MPRSKKIVDDSKVITLSKLSDKYIEDNECVLSELYISDFDEKMWFLIEKYYKLTIIGQNEGFIISTKNSWKGLIHFLLSILYCKIGGRIIGSQAKHGFINYIRVDTNFQNLKSSKSENTIIERLFVPGSYRPIYMRLRYASTKANKAIPLICKALKIDIEKSTLKVEASRSKTESYNYNNLKEVVEVDIRDKICALDGYLYEKTEPYKKSKTLLSLEKMEIKIINPLENVEKMINYNTGIAFAKEGIIESLIDKFSIAIADIKKNPRQMEEDNQDKQNKFLAYPVLKIHEEKLMDYFPLCKDSIRNYAEKSSIENICYYIITDFKYIGFWG